MFESFTPGNLTKTLLLIAAALVIGLVAWLAVGIDDNPLGLTLLGLSGFCLAGAFLHPIRESDRFRRIAWRTLIVMIGSIVLAFAIEGLGALLRPAGASEEGVLGGVAIYLMMAVMFVGVPTLLLSLAGALATGRREGHLPAK